MKIYTKTGDQGETGLRGGTRVPKDHPRVMAYGEVDELNSCLGCAHSVLPRRPAFSGLRKSLLQAQSDLFHIGSVLASPPGKDQYPDLPADAEKWLEREIDRMDKELPTLKNFILPGGSQAGALLHIARTVCRRAERALGGIEAGELSPSIRIYLNRLSDYLFTAARWVNQRLKSPEARWPGPKA